MFFGNAVAQTLFGWMATHPPLAERIRRIDPSFDGEFPMVAAAAAELEMAESPGRGRAGRSRCAGGDSRDATRAGRPRRADRNQSKPDGRARWHAAARARRVRHVALGVVAGRFDPHVARDQRRPGRRLCAASGRGRIGAASSVVRVCVNLDWRQQVAAASAMVSSLGPGARLPLVELAIPALRLLSRDQFADFQRTVKQLVEADRRMSLFEYALQRMLLRHLSPTFTGSRPPGVRYQAISALNAPVASLLSVLAYAGRDDDAGAQAAFAAGVKACYDRSAAIEMLPREQARLKTLDEALGVLAQVVGGHQAPRADGLRRHDRRRWPRDRRGRRTAASHRRRAGLPHAAAGSSFADLRRS